MNGNSQNNFRGGWNYIPPTHFSLGQIPHGSGPRAFANNWHIPHQMPAYYAHNWHIPHQAPAHYADNPYIPHQAPAHYVDNRNLQHQTPTHNADNRHLPHSMPTHYADNRHLPHPTSTHYADNRNLPHPTQTHYADNMHLPPQPMAHYADKRHLPHQTGEHHTDNKHLQHQTPERYEDKMCLPHPNPEDYADNKCLPHHTPDHYADKRQLSQQTSEACANKRQLPEQTSEACADKRQLPEQTSEQYADKNLSHQTPKDCADKRQLPDKTSEQYADKNLSQQTPKDCPDKKCLPQQTPEDCADKKCLPQQTPEEECANKKCLPLLLQCEICDLKLNPKCLEIHNKGKKHQRRLLELQEQSTKHKTSSGEEIRHNQSSQISKEAYAANKSLSHQTPDHYANKKCLLPVLHCEICDLIKLNPKDMKKHKKGKRHRRRLLELRDQSTKHKTSSGEEIRHNQSSQISKETYAANKCLSHQTLDHHADKRQLSQQMSEACADKRQLPGQTSEQYADKNLSQQTPKDCADKKCLPQQTPEDCADKKCLPPVLHGEIFDPIKLNPKCMENPKKRKRRQRRLLEVREQSTEHKTSSGEEIRHNQSSQISKEAYDANKCLSHQTPDHYADKRQLSQQTSEACAVKRQLPDQTSEQYADKNLSQQTPKDRADKKCLPQQTPEDCANKKCLPPVLHGEICDLTKLNPKCMENHKKRKRCRRRLLELREQSTEHKTSSGEDIRHNRSSQTIKEAYVDKKCLPQQTSKDFANKKPLPHQMPEAYADNKCLPHQMSAHYAVKNNSLHCEICDVRVGSGPKCLKTHNNGKKHQRRLLKLREKSMKHKDSNGKEISHIQSSEINPVVQPKNVPAEMSKRKVRDNTDAKDHGFKHEIEGATGGKYMKMNNGIRGPVKNDQPQSTPVELKASAGANIIAEKEYINCDFAATVIPQGPVASHVFTPPPPPPVESSFEPVTEHGLDTETEPHMSEAILYTESQHPAEETDIELLPPVLMAIDVALDVSAETKTEDGNSQAETKMDVNLSPESGKTKLPKVSVCLMCGNEGFKKAIVYCSKCGDYAMHRYCLARPVAFTDKVTWFCMDCEEVVAERPNNETPESEKDEVVHPQPTADPIWRGSLQVFNKSFDKISGLMGHLSTLACPKVLEEARHLPDVLYANLLQRSAVWPESFKKFGTNNQSIGLYFFPENERVERYYDHLVDEMISKDLAIRVMVEKTELLIFPSTLLPTQYKRFHSKYYLWGIFKRKQVSSTIKDTRSWLWK